MLVNSDLSVLGDITSDSLTSIESTLASSELVLDRPWGRFYNTGSGASGATYTTYTIATGAVTGGNCLVKINAASEPTITGATKLSGSATFSASTNMFMVVFHTGGANYYFLLSIA